MYLLNHYEFSSSVSEGRASDLLSNAYDAVCCNDRKLIASEADVERKRKERKEEDPSPFVLSSSPLVQVLRLPPAEEAIGNLGKMDSKFCKILPLTPHPFISLLTTYQLLQLTTQIHEALYFTVSNFYQMRQPQTIC